MRLLAEEDLVGLDPTLSADELDTPETCFTNLRDRFYTILREPLDKEREAWSNLLLSVCRQNNIDPAALDLP